MKEDGLSVPFMMIIPRRMFVTLRDHPQFNNLKKSLCDLGISYLAALELKQLSTTCLKVRTLLDNKYFFTSGCISNHYVFRH